MNKTMLEAYNTLRSELLSLFTKANSENDEHLMAAISYLLNSVLPDEIEFWQSAERENNASKDGDE